MWKRFFTTNLRFHWCSRTSNIHTSSLTKMQKVSVRLVPDEERMHISFNYGLEGKKQKEFNLHRLKVGELSETLERLNLSLIKKLQSQVKRKKKKNEDVAEITELQDSEQNCFLVALLDKDEQVMAPTVPNIEAWKPGCILDINGRKFPIQINPPLIRKIVLPQCILTGYPVYPNVDAEFSNLDECKYTWYKSNVVKYEIEKQNETESEKQTETESEKQNNTETENQNKTDETGDKNVSKPKSCKRKRTVSHSSLKWTQLCDGFLYTPIDDDIGCKLKVVCTPSDGEVFGYESECVSDTEVKAGPGYCPFEERHRVTQNVTDEDRYRTVLILCSKMTSFVRLIYVI